MIIEQTDSKANSIKNDCEYVPDNHILYKPILPCFLVLSEILPF